MSAPTLQAGPSKQSSDNAAGKKRRSNVNKACENCRRRRIKCDGVRPSCGTCAVYKDECYWEAREDYRKPLSRGQVEALVMRVKDLERLLRQHGLDPGTTPEDIGQGLPSPGAVADRDRKQEVKSEPPDPRDWSVDHLVEHESGDLQLHGPTSAFRHLHRYPMEQTSALNIYPLAPPNGNLPIGFSRHLPASVSLSQYEHDVCIDRFFKYYASWCLRTNPILFRQDMAVSTQPPFHRTPHYSPLLHNAILTIALGLSDDPELRHPSTRKKFADQAKSFIDAEGMNPSVATVQAFAHLAAYHSLGAQHNLGWLYIGMALRCAMAIGLNTDANKLVEKGVITPDQARARNVTFWTAVLQEGLWAPYIGRSIKVPEYTTGLPVIDESLDSLIFEFPAWSELQSQPSMLSTAFLETAKLMQIGERIMNTLYSLKVDMPTVDQTGAISEISLALSNWHENLPPSLVLNYASPKNALPHILMMHLAHAWLIILLHRPFYRPLNSMPGGQAPSTASASRAAWAVKQCDRAANHCIQMFNIWHRIHDLRRTPPTASQVCFVAGTTHLLSLASSRVSSKKHTEAAANVNECIRLLKLMAVSWPAAEQARILLEGLRTDYGLSGNLDIHPSPQGAGAALPSGSSSTSETFTAPPSASLPVDAFSSAFTSAFDLGTAAPSNIQATPISDPTDLWSSSAPFDPQDWQNFGNNLQLDRETQALFDNLLQPHLNIGFPAHDWESQFRQY